jgi:hypothetical protein
VVDTKYQSQYYLDHPEEVPLLQGVQKHQSAPSARKVEQPPAAKSIKKLDGMQKSLAKLSLYGYRHNDLN